MKTVVPKSGDHTHGLSRFFASTCGKTIPGLSFFAVSLISVKEQRSYPMLIEQMIRAEAAETPPEQTEVFNAPRNTTQTRTPEREQKSKQDGGYPQRYLATGAISAEDGLSHYR